MSGYILLSGLEYGLNQYVLPSTSSFMGAKFGLALGTLYARFD